MWKNVKNSERKPRKKTWTMFCLLVIKRVCAGSTAVNKQTKPSSHKIKQKIPKTFQPLILQIQNTKHTQLRFVAYCTAVLCWWSRMRVMVPHLKSALKHRRWTRLAHTTQWRGVSLKQCLCTALCC